MKTLAALSAHVVALAMFLTTYSSASWAQTITLSGTSASFASTGAQPQPPAQNISITNSGASQLVGVQVSAVTYTAGQPTGWLTASNTSGPNTTIAPGNAQFINMSVVPGSLSAGAYTASYSVSATNSTNGPLTVNVTFTVAGPTLQLSNTSATFASTNAQPQAPAQNIAINNTGSSVMTGVQVSAVSYTPGQPTGWLTASNTSGPNTTINPGNTQFINMSVVAGSLPAGSYTASFVVSAGNSTNGPITVNVTFTVAGPTLQLGSNSATFASTAAQPQPAAQNNAITNVGSSTLTGVQVSAVSYTAGQPTGWLTASNTSGPNTTINPGNAQFISMSVVPGSLSAGTYTASYTVSASNATNGPLTVNVTFTVAGAILSLSSTSATFASTNAQPQAPTQNISITNVGSSTLTGVQVSAVSYTAGQPVGWLTASNTSGPNTTIAPGNTQIISMSVVAGSLPAGTYTASYTVSATNSTAGPFTVNVTFNVAGPTLQLASTAATFASTSAQPQATAQNIALTNSGSSVMTGVQVSAVSYTAGQPTGWLTASNTSGPNTTVSPGNTQFIALSATAGSLPAGTYTASFTVSASNATNGPITVNITFTVFGPRIQLSSTTANFTSFAASLVPPAQNIAIDNTGSSLMTGLQVSTVTYGAGQPVGWLTAANTSGPNTTLSPGNTQFINLSVSPNALPIGTYTATFTVSATNANNGPLTVTVTLNRSAPPVIQFNPASQAFTAAVNGASPAGAAVNVTGAGLSDLAVQGIAYGSGQPTGWLAATLASATTPTTLNLQATTGSLAVGSYSATVTLASTATGATNTFPVTFVITPPPAISVTPAVALSALQGQSATQSISVGNSGGGTLTGLSLGAISYGAGQPSGWLTSVLASTTAPTQVNLSASAAGLNVGVYTATVPIASSAPGVSNSPRTVTITFTVTAPPVPTIALSATSLVFNAQAATTSPAAQTINVTNSGAGTLDGLAAGAVSYGAGQPTGWLATSLSATAAPSTWTFTPTLGALPAGTYTATVAVSSTAPNVSNSPRTVSVTFVVTTPPTMSIGPSALTFSAPANGANPPVQTASISNSGAGTVQGLAIGTITFGSGQPTGWLTASLNSTTAPAVLSVNATTGTLAVGTYTATIPITSTTAVNSPQLVTVTFNVTPVPAIALSATAVTFSSNTGGASPAQQNITVTNGGTGTLTGLVLDAVVYPAGQPIGWLAPTLSGTTAPATIGLQVNNTAFPPGNYTATLAVRSSVASNSPQTITVNYTLVGTPAIALSTSSLSFGGVAGGANPAAQLVNVTNGGTGTLNGLAVGSITYGPGASGWLSATASGTTTPMTITVQPNLGSLAAGTYDATVNVTSNNASNSPQQFTVRLVVSAPVPTNSIVVTPGTLMLSMQARSPSTRTTTAQISNGGTGPLTGLTVGAPVYVSGSGWLSVSLGGTSTPATMTLRGSTRTLSAGVYQATVSLGATSAATVLFTITLEVVDLKACERALTDATQLSSSERTRLDQLGNNDGTYNLGDYLALRARLGL
ncbi:MAG: hypothetical protein H7Z40_10350 [Phycisphaerae bacterium]|nr:hypothetical protein [Gemmatimonadaceae bacterium]